MSEEILPGSGLCDVCGQIKVQVGEGKPICLAHGVRDNPPSGLRIVAKDPGHDEIMKTLKVAGIRVEKGTTTGPVTRKSGPTVQIVEPVQKDNSHVVVELSLQDLDQFDLVSYVMTSVYEALDNMQFTTIKDARYVMKIQDNIKKVIEEGSQHA